MFRGVHPQLARPSDGTVGANTARSSQNSETMNIFSDTGGPAANRALGIKPFFRTVPRAVVLVHHDKVRVVRGLLGGITP